MFSLCLSFAMLAAFVSMEVEGDTNRLVMAPEFGLTGGGVRLPWLPISPVPSR